MTGPRTIAEQIAEQLSAYGTGPVSSVLMSLATVEWFDPAAREWVAEASGSSIAYLAAAADDVAELGAVRVITHYGAVLAGEGRS